MIKEENISAIGKFQKTHALKGELNAILDIDMDFVSEGNALVIKVDGIFVPFYASSIRPKGTSSFLIKLEGIESEAEAKPFVNKDIFALKSELAPFLEMEEDEIMDEDDLIGFEIMDGDKSLGKIARIDSSTQNLLFIVKTEDDDEIFVPAVDEFISQIDNENRVIKMNLPDGLVDLNQ